MPDQLILTVATLPDTYVQEDTAGTSRGSMATVVICNEGEFGGEIRRGIISGDVSALAGKVVSSAPLMASKVGPAWAGSVDAAFHRSNVYPVDEDASTGTTWSSSSGGGVEAVPDPVLVTIPSGATTSGDPLVEIADLTTLVQDAIDNRSGQLSIAIKMQDESYKGSKPLYGFRAAQSAVAGDRMQLVINYDVPPEPPQAAGFSGSRRDLRNRRRPVL